MSRPRILVVEDHGDSLHVLERLLRLNGYEVVSAFTATEALALAAKERYDLLISDIGLPDGSGVELMRELQKFYPIPGIAVTGHGDADHARACAEAGFAKRLLKPVMFSSLLEAISELVDPPPSDAAPASSQIHLKDRFLSRIHSGRVRRLD